MYIRNFSMGPQTRSSMYARECIQQLARGGATVAGIVEALMQEGIVTCRQTVWQLLWRIENHGTLDKCGCLTKVRVTVLQAIDGTMQKDDEITAKELVVTLRANGVYLSTTTFAGMDKTWNCLLSASLCTQSRLVN